MPAHAEPRAFTDQRRSTRSGGAGRPGAPILEAVNVSKAFGAAAALAEVDLSLHPGRVHALLGENGAGKSTLTLVLSGAWRPDSDQLMLDGAPTSFAHRGAAIAAGIGLVPQSLSLIGELTLEENHLLSLAAGGTRWLRRAAARRQLADAAAQAEVDLPLNRRARDLPFGQRQLAEVVLGLAQGARVLLLDEPTAAAGPVDAKRLLDRVRRLADTGTAIVLVTHRLDEVLAIADEVTVLRGGRRVHHGPASAVSPHELAELMVGKPGTQRSIPVTRATRGLAPLIGPGSLAHPPGAPLRLQAQGLHAVASLGSSLRDISLAVVGGDILGIAGVAGSGQRILAETLVGLRRPDRGTVVVDGVDITGQPAVASARGVGYLPDDRAAAVLGAYNVTDNAVALHAGATELTFAGLRRRRPAQAVARALCQRFDVQPPNPELLAAALSGGNQQKLMAGRELVGSPAVLVAHGPTQGLDMMAAANLRRELRAAADAGAAVVLISADLEEVLSLSDQVAVLVAGRLVHEVRGATVDRFQLGRTMAGLT